MVGVHAHRVGLEIEGVLAILHLLQLILVQVWPAPDPGIDHMWKAFSPSDLQEGMLISSHRWLDTTDCITTARGTDIDGEGTPARKVGPQPWKQLKHSWSVT